MPVKVTVCGLVKAPSAKVSAPVTEPAADGANLTATEQLALAGILAPQAFVEMTNPALAVTLVSDKATLRWFVTVTVLAELVVFTGTVPKFRELPENVSGAVPVPDKLTT